MNYPKYFSPHSVGSLYVITSKDIGFSIRDDKTRGTLNWTLAEMSRTNGFKPATVAEIRRFIPDYKPAPLISHYCLKGGFCGTVAFFRAEGDKVTRVFKSGIEEAAEEEFSLASILEWVKGGLWEKISLSSARKMVTKAPPKSELAAAKEEILRLKAIIAASKKELEKA